MAEVALLIGHGSRDRAGREELAALLAAVRAAAPACAVELGVLEFADGEAAASIDDALDRCVQHGATSLRIVPLLLHSAMHAQSDVPAVMRRAAIRYPELTLELLPALTAEPRLLDVIADRLRAANAPAGKDASAASCETTVLLVGRGSSDAAANAEFFATGRLLAEQGWPVECAFISLAQPDVPSALERCRRLGAQRIVVAPYFLNTGILVRRIGEQAAAFAAAHPEMTLVVTPHLSVDARLVELIRERVAPLDRSAASALATRPALARYPLLERYGLPPGEIEALSQRRIARLLPRNGEQDDAWSVVQRMVYAAGDPDLAPLVRVHPHAVEAAVAALRRGEPLLTDVRMVDVGLDRGRMQRLGLTPRCAISEADPGPSPAGLTRAAAGMVALADGLEGGIVVVGNAPTALLGLLDLIDAGRARPAAIVGTPVGFVAAAEAKAELAVRGTPFITIEGTRGGSAVAAAACNALLRLACAAPAEVLA